MGGAVGVDAEEQLQLGLAGLLGSLGGRRRWNGDQAGAEKEYCEAEKINPNNGQVLLEMAKMLFTSGDLDGALARLKRAVELMPSAQAVHYQLGIVYRRLGQNEEAERHFSLVRQLQAGQPATSELTRKPPGP